MKAIEGIDEAQRRELRHAGRPGVEEAGPFCRAVREDDAPEEAARTFLRSCRSGADVDVGNREFLSCTRRFEGGRARNGVAQRKDRDPRDATGLLDVECLTR